MKLSYLLLFIPFISFGQSVKHIKKETVWVVNKNGKKIKIESETDYNSKGEKIKISSDLCEVFTYEYKDNRKVKSSRALCKGGREDLTLYAYDKLGRLIQEVNYEGGRKFTGRTVNHYVGNSTHMDFSESFNGNEKTSYEKTTYEYYPNGLLKKEIQTAGGSWFGTNEYKYDANKNMIYQGSQVDGGVGLVKYYYTYQNNILIKDKVIVPDTGTEYHIYEHLFY